MPSKKVDRCVCDTGLHKGFDFLYNFQLYEEIHPCCLQIWLLIINFLMKIEIYL